MRRVQEAGEIVEWVNGELSQKYELLDELKDGAALVQLVHKLNPESFDLSRCDFNAKTQYHYERNFKLLQDVVTKNGIPINFVIERLVQGEHQRDLFNLAAYLKLHYRTFQQRVAHRRHEAAAAAAAAVAATGADRSAAGVRGSRSGEPGDPDARPASGRPPSATSTTTTSSFRAAVGKGVGAGPGSGGGGGLKSALSSRRGEQSVRFAVGPGKPTGAVKNIASMNSDAMGAGFGRGEDRAGGEPAPYDAAEHRRRAVQARRSRLTSATSAARSGKLDSMSNSDTWSNAPSRHSTGRLGIRPLMPFQRLRSVVHSASSSFAGGVGNAGAGVRGSRSGAILNWACSIQTPPSSVAETASQQPLAEGEALVDGKLKEGFSSEVLTGTIAPGGRTPTADAGEGCATTPLSGNLEQLSFSRVGTSVGGGTINNEIAHLPFRPNGAAVWGATINNEIVQMVRGERLGTAFFEMTPPANVPWAPPQPHPPSADASHRSPLSGTTGRQSSSFGGVSARREAPSDGDPSTAHTATAAAAATFRGFGSLDAALAAGATLSPCEAAGVIPGLAFTFDESLLHYTALCDPHSQLWQRVMRISSDNNSCCSAHQTVEYAALCGKEKAAVDPAFRSAAAAWKTFEAMFGDDEDDDQQ